ncbi:hypothetical protein L3X38_025696 [Prunus dulcis]|uniref:Uncharacterized protein n=1 Tax=Prunus dulcis TaxID=3755 RepID=A0AAD4W3B5_PRUDU|nr:hypothetical protein L3X38_025696 [Prunus dulcis]
MSELRSAKSYALVTTSRLHWDNNAPLLQCPRAATRAGVQSDKASPENLQITSHPPDYRFYSTSGTLYSTTPKSNSDDKWSESASKTHGLTGNFTASIRGPP